MAKFGLIGAAYASQSPIADGELLMNWYVEKIESGAGQNDFALYPTPGLKAFADLGGNSVRGQFTSAGREFAVSGTNFIEVSSTGVPAIRGTLSNDSLPVSMAGNEQQILIASAGTAYVFDLMANTLTPLPPATFTGPVSLVAYVDSQFIALIADSSKWYVSNLLDATTWDASKSTLTQFIIGNIISMIVSHREIWFFGASNTVVYYDSGNFPFPFDVNQTADIEKGIAAKFSVCLLDNTLFWLGSDPRGKGIVFRANGYNPVRVSNHAIEFAMQGYSRIDDAVAYSYQDQGHEFYVLYFPSADKTWTYDVATGMWHQRGFWDTGLADYTAHRSQNHSFCFGKHLVGDWKTGLLYEMAIPQYSGGAWLFADDNNNPIRRLRRAPHISKEQKWMFHHKIQILLESGLGPIPPLSGTEAPTVRTLADSAAAIWSLTVDDSGILGTAPYSGVGQDIFLNDGDTNTTSWKVVLADTMGTLGTEAVTYSPLYPQIIPMVSESGTERYGLNVDVNGIIGTQLIESISRAPQIIVRWSSDGGKTFGNEHVLNCGKAGEYRARAIQRRLGRARDRVYEIFSSDPIPWRVVDGYVEVSGG